MLNVNIVHIVITDGGVLIILKNFNWFEKYQNINFDKIY